MNVARIFFLTCIFVFSFSQANAQSTQTKGPAKVVSLGLASGNSSYIQGRAALIVRFNENDLVSTDTTSNNSHCNPPNQFFVYDVAVPAFCGAKTSSLRRARCV